MTHLPFPPYSRFPTYLASILLPTSSLFALVAAISQCLCSESPFYQLNFTVFMFVTRISLYIYIYIYISIFRYYPRFHVTAAFLGTYFPWISGHTIISPTWRRLMDLSHNKEIGRVHLLIAYVKLDSDSTDIFLLTNAQLCTFPHNLAPQLR
jgi:hypothetical protein